MLTKNAQEFAQNLPVDGRLIGLDLGGRHVGVAVSDSRRVVASARPALKRSAKWQPTEDAILALIAEITAVGIVVGWPLDMSGERGASADKMESLAHKLSVASNLPILLWDERLTTVAAENALFERRTAGSRQTRGSRKAIKADVDSSAAVLILGGVLERLSGPS